MCEEKCTPDQRISEYPFKALASAITFKKAKAWVFQMKVHHA